jgi:hypothetical protein
LSKRKLGRRPFRLGRGEGTWSQLVDANAFPDGGELVDEKVRAIVAERDSVVNESLTRVSLALESFARSILEPSAFSPQRKRRLGVLARKASVRVITRTLLSWRSDFPDQTVRRLKKFRLCGWR